MKKYILFILVLLLGDFSAFGQAKKPTLMVVPSDLYCKKYGYVQEFTNEGKVEIVSDYQQALQSDEQLLLVITELGKLMAERGFPLKLLEQEMKSLRDEAAEDAMLTSQNGSEVAENPIDLLRKSAKCDIILQVTWTVNKAGPKHSLSFNLQGIDAYTNKQIAASTGTGEPSFTAEIPVLLRESVINHIEPFNEQLMQHFNDMSANGREIALQMKRWEDAGADFETEIYGEELGQIIEDWLAENCVKGRFSTSNATANMMRFEQVRIPLYDEKGRANDARRWARGLVRKLTSIGITSKLMTKGLGQATIVIGGK